MSAESSADIIRRMGQRDGSAAVVDRRAVLAEMVALRECCEDATDARDMWMARAEAAERERDSWERAARGANRAAVDAMVKAEAAEAEVARLRTALPDWVALDTAATRFERTGLGDTATCQELRRAAALIRALDAPPAEPAP